MAVSRGWGGGGGGGAVKNLLFTISGTKLFIDNQWNNILYALSGTKLIIDTQWNNIIYGHSVEFLQVCGEEALSA